MAGAAEGFLVGTFHFPSFCCSAKVAHVRPRCKLYEKFKREAET